jgi:hypothetical protein
MPYIAPDYFRREMLIDLFSVHDISRRNVHLEGLYTPDGGYLKESSATFSGNSTEITTWMPKKLITNPRGGLQRTCNSGLISGDLDLNRLGKQPVSW